MPAEDHSPDPGPRAALRCREVSVDYAGVPVLRELSLQVHIGEIVALLGASGSGKSTLLNTVAGHLRPSVGDIWVGEQQVASRRHNMPPEQRDIGMVFQNFALWPHLSVLDTVAYPARRAGHSKRDAALSAAELLTQLGIEHLARRRPAQLSGGEQQRVGLARALARNAQLYLLDEPTAHLDTHLRAAFQQAVLDRQHQLGAAVVYATHDAAEALAIADRIALIVSGRMVQVAEPAVVYSRPASLAAAQLTGPCDVLEAHVAALPGGELSVDFGDGVACVIGGAGAVPRSGLSRVLVRPDWVHIGGTLAGEVVSVAFGGTQTRYRLATRAGMLQMALPGPPGYAHGETVSLRLSQAWVLDGGEAGGRGAASQPNAVTAPE